MNRFAPRVGEILVLSRQDVENLLGARSCYERCMEVFRWVGEGLVDQVNPVNLYITDRREPEPEFGHGVVQAFPALIRPLHRAGVKWLSSFRRNPIRGLPAITALNLLTDSNTGMPLALLDGTTVTAYRTAGHAAVGAHYLARPDSSRVAILGCGSEGRTHLRLMAALFPLEIAVVFDIDGHAAGRFAREMAPFVSTIVVADSVEEAVDDADIICVVTTADQPILTPELVPAGAHVCAATGFRDVDYRCATEFDKWVVGYYGRDLEWIEGSELGRIGGLSPGLLTRDDIYADIATEIAFGTKPGRETNEERTIMTHMGMPALDAAVSALVYEKALESGAGQWIRVF